MAQEPGDSPEDGVTCHGLGKRAASHAQHCSVESDCLLTWRGYAETTTQGSAAASTLALRVYATKISKPPSEGVVHGSAMLAASICWHLLARGVCNSLPGIPGMVGGILSHLRELPHWLQQW